MKKYQIIFPLLTIGFLCILIGVYIGRNTGGTFLAVPQYDTHDLRRTQQNVFPPDQPGKIDINNASAQQLTVLPQIGDSLAREIVSYRDQVGCFLSIEEIRCVDGVSDYIFRQIRDYITVGDHDENTGN